MRVLNRIIIGLFVLAAVLYGGDWLVLHFRHTQFGTVQVQRYDVVPQKDKKLEFYPEDPVQQTCVHSLFPHFGDPPCWWLERHKNQQVNM